MRPQNRRGPRCWQRPRRRRLSCEAAAKAAIEKEKEAADKAWAERASRLAVEIAAAPGRPAGRPGRAGRLPGLAAQGDPGSAGTGAAGAAANGVALEAISATPLDPAEQERYRDLISEAFGAHPQIAFKSDPALIAGLELHGPHLVVSNSWRADLAQILADLAHDNRF